MSVIVRGVEMPKNCALCKFRGVGETWCPFTLQEVPGNTIPEDCPLSPVPEHGRLIDADATRVSFVYAEETGDWSVPQMRTVLEIIDAAPTIIPADDAWPEWRTQVLGIRRQEEE